MRTSTLSRLTLQKASEGRASCKRYPSWRLGSQLSAWSRLRGSPVSCTHGSHPVLPPPFLGATWRRGPHASLDLLLRQPQYTLPLGGKTFKFTGNILLRSVFCSAFSLSLRVFQQGKKKITLPIFNGRVIFKRSPRRTRLRRVRRRQAPWQARGAHRDLRFAPCPLALREAP